MSGRRPYFYWYDVPTGKVRKVPRVFSSGREEKHLETFAASPDGRWLAFVGAGGESIPNHRRRRFFICSILFCPVTFPFCLVLSW